MRTDAHGRRAVLSRVRSGELDVEEAARLLLTPPIAESAPRDLVLAWLAGLVSEEAKIPAERIVPEERLDRHGFDSVMALNLVRALERDLGKLPATLLFEYQTLAALADYLLERHGHALAERFGAPHEVAAPAAAAAPDGPRGTGEPIAIVGLSGRFPLADDLDEFWDNLVAGRDCITEVPAGRWDVNRHFDPTPGTPGKTYSRWGGFIRDVDAFDNAFFSISPREAERMDPQERLFLQEVWHALEDAGLTRAGLSGTAVGVYVGVMYSQYQLYQAEQALHGNALYLGSSYASIANRVSHYFDFRGPSLALDSMCSSSLTALHLAGEALRRGDITTAVVGGVNLTIHPAKHVDLSQGRFASTDGRCRSFGAGGDGYVPGEGVGVAVLKPLAAAIAAGDRVHAVILGSAIGHGGRTNGYSVPNPAEQTRLIRAALDDAGVDPADIGYVEAHGTGTALGDPIEVRALAQALGEREPGAPARAIGSVKSNVGHLEAAAGIAGLVKIVLQMRHRTLVPSLHADPPNPHLDLATAGLRVPRSAEEWAAPEGGLRTAGLSSFGAGGANAHVVVREFRPAPAPTPAAGPQLILLSAQTPERLRAVAASLAAETDSHTGTSAAEWLARAAHTLRVGREHFEHRLALVAADTDDLGRRLRAFAGTGTHGDGLVLGSVDSATRAADADRARIADLLTRGALAELGELWVRGIEIDWSTPDGERPLRTALPGYPFLRERHWPRLIDAADAPAPPLSSPHPLLHRNESTFDRQRFVTSFDGSAPLVRDHTVGGRALLPAAAAVEMVLAAGRASGLTGPLSVRETVLEAPIEVPAGARLEVAVELHRLESGVAYTLSDLDGGKVYARGRVVAGTVPAPDRLDIEAMTAACGAPVEAERCYRALAESGLLYGPALRVLEHVRPGQSRVLARFRLSEKSGSAPYDVHPALLDGAFQALVGFSLDGPAPARVPFVIEEVATTATRLPTTGWILATARSTGGQADVFDLALADDSGTVAVRVTGLAVRPVAAGQPDNPRHDTVVLRPVWRPTPLPDETPTTMDGGTVLVFDHANLGDQIRRDRPGIHVVTVQPGDGWERVDGDTYRIDLADHGHYRRLLDEAAPGQLRGIVHAWSYAAPVADAAATEEHMALGFGSLLALCTALANHSSTAEIRLVCAHPAGVPAYAALGSFHRVVATEHPTYRVSTVESSIEDRPRRVLAELTVTAAGAEQVRYDDGVREVLGLTEHTLTAGPQPREGGVYLVTGALGGLGRIVARHLAERRHARLVLTGRSALDEDGAAFLQDLERAGGNAVYLAADCATGAGARSLVDEAMSRFGRLDGVVHLAGVLRDGLLIGKRRADAAAVLAPKVWGTYHLDDATRDLPLEFFALYSSATSVMGVTGQSDYAYANGFLNWFADWREQRRQAGQRSGATVAVAWPLWRSGGMDVDDASKTWIEENLGWVPLPPEHGTTLFEASLRQDTTQLTVFHGHRERILRAVDAAAPPSAEATTPPPGADLDLDTPAGRALLAHLRQIVSEQLQLPVDRLDPRARFERLGLESVMVMNVTNRLSEVFGDLPKTLFFEYQTLADLAAHLLHRYPAAAQTRFGTAGPVRPDPAPAAPRADVRPVGRESSPARDTDEPIAVVGLSGRYPMAATLEEFWENLRRGRDCVTEVPSDRWDHDRFFTPGPGDAGKAYSKWGGFLDGVDEFDPLFFGISPREARLMDPQERLFLQTAWHTLEDAGYARAGLSHSRVGVFVGVMYNQYQLYGAGEAMQARGFVPSSLAASVANRVSYVLGLTGPSLALDTMCSSSLTALHLACASIRAGDCDQALAGGVNAILHPNRYLQLSQARFASTDGRCRSFGLGGDGYVPGEGVGAVLLKPLSRAEADGDHIYGLIRGSALNHGGRSNGYTVPTPVAQAQVVAEALARSGVHPDDLDYVEAHGTGTVLGDPIEVDGLAKAFAAAGSRRSAPCPIGSVKSNIGHLESAAGIAGITKVLLQFRHGELVPSLHADRLNPNIQFADAPLRVQRAGQSWPARTAQGRPLPRIASVSSFGAGGANAHVVLEEYPAATAAPGPSGARELVVLSARTAEQLRELARDLADRLDAPPAAGTPSTVDAALLDLVRGAAAQILNVPPADIDLDEDFESLGLDGLARLELAERVRQGHQSADLEGCANLRGIASRLTPSAVDGGTGGATGAPTPSLRDIAYTLAVGREPQRERLGVVAGDATDLAARLRAFCAGQATDGVYTGQASAPAGPLDTLFDGAAGESFLAALRATGDLDKLAQLWASGTDRAAAPTAGDRPARRLSLPTYPFARERYWLPEPGAADEAAVPARPEVPPAPAADRPAERSSRTDEVPVERSFRADEELPAMASTPPLDWNRAHRAVVDAMAAVLEISAEEFELDVPHTDLGVDSVLAVSIVDRVNEDLGTDLKPTDFFNYATLRKLADHLAQSVPAPPTVQRPVSPPVPAQPVVGAQDIAVIGMSGRFPRARNLDELWANLLAGTDAVGEIPAARWDVARHWDPDPAAPGKTYSKWGSVLEDIDKFDPDFFGISPREARLMDPQQRLYLMEAWRALEDAGYPDRALDGIECHAFVGTSAGDYQQLLHAAGTPVEGYTFMGSHPAVLASRLSYHLNLRGPSLAVDTSCSSSLMAVHLACEALRDGRADLAVAGGVAALNTPELHILASKAGMLSPRGRCQAFDDGADGFVPGEGVGAVVLKRLADAIRDGDPIHGVIAASGANQDGRSNGLTAPSAPSQAALLRSVYGRFDIDPGQIGYVECHGTGTRLGDPIEVEALTQTFRRYTERRGYCAIGSIKSNLGHTLTVAGIAGLLKTLLCIKHGMLVPSLHFAVPNRHIPFTDSPFYVNTEARAWEPDGGVARLGAVSSFGFSGTNVHAVVREAPSPAARSAEQSGRERLCPVSAKTPAALAERLDELAGWLERHGRRHEWRDVAHTLGAGRSHFPVRAAFVATDAGDLRDQIRAWRAGETGGPPVTGAGDLGDAARRYVSGGDVGWEALYGDEPARRIHLPTYPFAQESYWIPGAAAPAADTADSEWVFPHRLRPDLPLVRDHVVDRRPLLPAAGHLELLHDGLRAVLGAEPLTLTRLVWLRPVFVTDERTVEVVIRSAQPGRYAFEVRSTGPDGTAQVHSRGEVRTGTDRNETIDLPALGNRCPQWTDADRHYARFTRIGVLYGPHFTTVEEIRHSEAEALATLVRRGTGGPLPAGVLDGAIQSVAALQPDADGQRPYVPFAMDEIHLARPIPERSLAYVRQVKPGECDVSIMDTDGRVCVAIRGLSYRELKEPVRTRLYTPRWRELDPPAQAAMTEPDSVLVVAPANDYGLAERLVARHRPGTADIIRLRAGEAPDALSGRLRQIPPPARVYFLGGLDDGFDGAGWDSLGAAERAQESGVLSLFRVVTSILAAGGSPRPVELISVTADAHSLDGRGPRRPFGAAIFGLTRSLAKEQTSWQVGCVDVATGDLTGDGAGAVATALAAEPGHPDGNEVVLRDGRRWTLVLSEAERVAVPAEPPFRRGGTYLILGGAGGIGAELAVHLGRRAAANVALLGRRPLNPEIQRQLDRVAAAGGTPAYFAVDAGDDAGMTAAVAAVRERFGPVHGAFHSALVLRDARLDAMDEANFAAVLAPKVKGAVVLARALREEPLDFLTFFSSAQSFSGNAGQANYAAACTFKDAFAAHLRGTGVPVHVVNWGYWGEVGIVAKAGYRQRMASVGVHSIDTADGMRAIEAVLANRLPQVMVLKAEQRVLERFGVQDGPAAHQAPGVPDPDRGAGWDPLAGRAPGAALDGDRLLAAHRRLDDLGAARLLTALQEMGAFTNPQERRSASTLAAELAVAPKHARLFLTLLDILVTAGYLTRDGEWLTATAAVAGLAARDLAAESRRLGGRSPEVAAHVDLLTACLDKYPDLLRGEVEATTVMFPGASASKVEGVYRGDPLSDRLNALAAQAVLAYVDGHGDTAPVRVLEIGAGTGGTSASVLAALRDRGDRVRYVYTDVSLGFLRHGRREFGADHPFMEFRRLDIESDPADQGFPSGDFDVVVAANVLHATRDLRETLDHVRHLLKDGGRLVLSETTAFSPFATLTFGLLDGWWRATDGEVRVPGSPLADVPTWTRLLHGAGLGRTTALAPAEVTHGEMGQHVLVAEREPAAAVESPTSLDLAETRRIVSSTVAEVLGRDSDDLDVDRPFTEYGVDSIILVELVNTLNARLGTNLKPTALFDHPTLAELTEHVCADRPGADGGRRGKANGKSNGHGHGPAETVPADVELLQRLAAGELSLDDALAKLGGEHER
ncbi:SDR family NAD(P)-dependent oxidoreductase [Phytohabitans sp. LJ34]|uniref:SDR family NAD(P)-dependent oxidoreductase n=1 Tax=Phytohabitans sp. LJ34 TaxID=3452217 RepID=UPI003F8AB0DA